MARDPDMQGCEHCEKQFPIETMTMMEDCWFCEGCREDFQKMFDACDHKWTPHVDVMGDPGQYCERCSGFVRDEDMPSITGVSPAIAQS